MDKLYCTVPTGKLVACVNTDPDYPGICIYFKRGEKSLLIARVEHPTADAARILSSGTKQILGIQVYADPELDDPTYSEMVFEEALEESPFWFKED